MCRHRYKQNSILGDGVYLSMFEFVIRNHDIFATIVEQGRAHKMIRWTRIISVVHSREPYCVSLSNDFRFPTLHDWGVHCQIAEETTMGVAKF